MTMQKSQQIPLSELVLMDATSIDDCARLIGVSRSLLYDEIRKGKLIKKKIRNRSLVTKIERLRYLNTHSTSAQANFDEPIKAASTDAKNAVENVHEEWEAQ